MASASPFSFHCMICFEEFDAVNRYPVVLPCGHTYICRECGMKLDKCMECRTSLFTLVAVNEQCSIVSPQLSNDRRAYNPNRNRQASRRVRDTRNEAMMQHEQHQQKSQQALTTKLERLPLPKNAVLLSLMEATEFTSENVKMASQISTSKDEGDKSNENEVEPELVLDEEEEEEQLILQNLSVVTSACGTYAVASKQCLKIVPTRPCKNRSRSMSPQKDLDSNRFHRVLSNIDRDVDRIVKATNNTPTGKSRRNANCDGSLQSRSESADSLDSMTLSYGDRVQVVSINDGWAKLARGYGFVYCKNGTELVKVGNAVDKACRIEAILHNLALRRSKLKREQDKLDNESVKLMNIFQNHLMHDDDITVVDASSFSSFSIPVLEENEANTVKIPEKAPTYQKAKSAIKSESPPRQARSDNNEKRGSMFNLSPSSFFSRFSVENDENRSPSTVQQQLDSSLQTRSTPAPINSNLLAGAREWRRKNDKNAARGINFRTGMSGHMGAHSTYTHPHDYLYETSRKMSSHSGLTVRSRR